MFMKVKIRVRLNKTHPPNKCNGNPFCSSCVIPITNQYIGEYQRLKITKMLQCDVGAYSHWYSQTWPSCRSVNPLLSWQFCVAAGMFARMPQPEHWNEIQCLLPSFLLYLTKWILKRVSRGLEKSPFVFRYDWAAGGATRSNPQLLKCGLRLHKSIKSVSVWAVWLLQHRSRVEPRAPVMLDEFLTGAGLCLAS